MKRLLSICDIEPDYSYRLMEVINMRRTSPFTARAFTSAQTLNTFLQIEDADVLLISPNWLTDVLPTVSGQKVFLLADDRTQDLPEGFPVIDKYQAVDEIIRDILEEYEIVNIFSDRAQGKADIIGIYSPLHRLGKTTFALALGQEIGRDKKVLYLNLESCSGFAELFGKEYDVDLSDLLYFARQDAGLALSRIAASTFSFCNIDYVPPARVPVELTDITAEEWNHLLDQLIGSGIYDVIMIDFGEGIRGLLTLLDRCDRIYTPIADDYLSKSKLRQYEDMLELLDYSEILEKTRMVSLPPREEINEGSLYQDGAIWGAYSGFVRELLEEEKEEAL